MFNYGKYYKKFAACFINTNFNKYSYCCWYRNQKYVTLADLLLMFLYLEVLAMVRVFWSQQSISITLPLLIAITALSRFIILQGKEMDPSGLVYEAVAIALIASAIVILRLRHSDKLGIKPRKKRK